MVSKTYSLRPPAPGATKDVLETLFRVEMKRDDLAAEGFKPGDAICVTSQATGKGGVGIAWLSTTDTTKSQGNNSFVKMNPKLREYMGLELSDKCSIARYEGVQRTIKTIHLSRSGIVGAEVDSEKIAHWASVALEQLPGIIEGVPFNASLHSGLQSTIKMSLTTDKVSSDDPVPDLAVPFKFEHGTSEVVLGGSNVSKPEETAIRPRFDGLPGLDEQLKQLSGIVERVDRQVDARLQHLAGCVPVLLHGPTGTGKSAVMSQLATNAAWKKVSRLTQADISSASTSKMRSAVLSAFTEAATAQPSLIILDDLHAIAGRNEETAVASGVLCDLLQSVKGKRVQVVAAARRPVDVDLKLLSCFKKKIELPSPTPSSRLEILRHYSAQLAEEGVLQYVAEKTHAFTASDLEDLCFAAYEAAEARGLGGSDGTQTNGVGPADESSDLGIPPAPMTLLLEDFQVALRFTHPSLMHELYIEVPKVKWSDIAGSDAVKHKIWEAVELPLKNPEIVSHLNLHLNHGILLYGPPGCSKTMTAKAIATESGLNFIAVKGPELVSKYVGESEYKIREIFRKARAASPSVIFFDEIDSIAPNREGGGGHEGLNTVATLLNEMDGVEDVQRVLVLAATNRPDAIDPALLRPGRLGTSLYVGPPNYDAVLQILQMRTSKMGNSSEQSQVALEEIAGKIIDNGCFSGADVAALCDAAGMLCATEAVHEGMQIKDIKLVQRHLDEAFEQAKPSLNKTQLEFLQGWTLGSAH